MPLEAIAGHLETFIRSAQSMPGLILLGIVFFMAVESSFIPFPSEVIMIPAGFLVYRGPLPTGNHAVDLVIVITAGLAGSMLGAYVNYFLSAWLGRPFLRRYGRFFFLSEPALDRAEEIFRKYGEIVTFVCRLLPAIRQLISIPAGLSRMNPARFSLFTALGAGIWTSILTGTGYFLGRSTGDMSCLEMAVRGKEIISSHYGWILAALAFCIALYALLRRWIMRPEKAA